MIIDIYILLNATITVMQSIFSMKAK